MGLFILIPGFFLDYGKAQPQATSLSLKGSPYLGVQIQTVSKLCTSHHYFLQLCQTFRRIIRGGCSLVFGTRILRNPLVVGNNLNLRVCFKLYNQATNVSTTCKPGHKLIISRPENMFSTKPKVLQYVLTILEICTNVHNLFLSRVIYYISKLIHTKYNMYRSLVDKPNSKLFMVDIDQIFIFE